MSQFFHDLIRSSSLIDCVLLVLLFLIDSNASKVSYGTTWSKKLNVSYYFLLHAQFLALFYGDMYIHINLATTHKGTFIS
jgi:hypothetical protein